MKNKDLIPSIGTMKNKDLIGFPASAWENAEIAPPIFVPLQWIDLQGESDELRQGISESEGLAQTVPQIESI